ncbi:DUF262 domain-containing protein [Nocardioides sp. NPDC058538]|uniref:DUF262 domain-containing protein n=1 Tax=Nocardioides sp. NPDC058538 TaxID=3346542 RepID=UPI00365CC1F0
MQHKTRDFPLDEMIRLVASGGAALPEFQRKFVWDPNQVVELLDSVRNGWPIGSLLMLEGPQPFGIKSLEGGPTVEPEYVRFYLLDGQQRVTSLYHALTDTGEYVYYVDFADEDVEEDDAPRIRWAPRARGIPVARRSTAITVAALSDDRFFDDWTSRLSMDDATRARKVRKTRLGYIAGGEYEIPSTVMLRDIDLEALTRIFETLNRTGLRLDAFDLMVAVLYPDGFNLRNEWERASESFPIFDEMGSDGLEILKLIALWRRDEDRMNPAIRPSRRVMGVRQRDVLRTPPSYVRQHWQRAIGAYSEALEFLRVEGGIRDGDGVPSDAMTLTLAYALNSDYSLDAVRSWYWTSIADQRYLQGANTQVLADITAFRRSHHDPGAVLTQMRISLQEPIRRNRILRMGVRGLLIRNGALDPLTGTRLEGPTTDVSIVELAGGKVAMSPDRPATEILVFSRESASELKHRIKNERPEYLLDPIALGSQEVPSLSALGDGDWQTSRIQTFLSWMESML